MTILGVSSLVIFLALSFIYFSDSYNSEKDIVWAAGSNGKVSGLAWSEAYGWISFNSKDCDTDNDGTFEGASETGGAAPAGCPASGTVNPYSIDINAAGDLTGFAWSENAGWIYFGPDSADIGGGYGAQLAASAPNNPKTWPHYDKTNGKVTGWAKVLSLGNGGWIKMSDDSVGVWNGKGVQLVSSGGANYDFKGWAWSGDTNTNAGAGWISFNSTDFGAGGSAYKVIASGLAVNTSPSAFSPSAPNWTYQNAADLGARQTNLDWSFSDTDKFCIGGSNNGGSCVDNSYCPGGSCNVDIQSAYQVIVNTINSTSSPLFDSGKVSSGATRYATTSLNWDTQYYWWVRVWDSKDSVSNWTQYASATDTNGTTNPNNNSFKTFKHEFPDVSFTWSPTSPSRDEDVDFTSTSTIYLNGQPTTPVAATSTNATWLWTFANGTPSTAATANPTAKFTSPGNNQVTLRVTDNEGYYTETTTTMNTKLKLPSWQEQKPQ